ncbi:cellulose synthase, partial [Acidithiobacillus ferriphilus]|nr:cellulose synthase [Acidithiobacillus ferriphilus]
MKRKYATTICSAGLACLLLGIVPAIAQTTADPVSLPLSALAQGKKITVLRSGHETAQLTWKVQPHYTAQN